MSDEVYIAYTDLSDGGDRESWSIFHMEPRVFCDRNKAIRETEAAIRAELAAYPHMTSLITEITDHYVIKGPIKIE